MGGGGLSTAYATPVDPVVNNNFSWGSRPEKGWCIQGGVSRPEICWCCIQGGVSSPEIGWCCIQGGVSRPEICWCCIQGGPWPFSASPSESRLKPSLYES